MPNPFYDYLQQHPLIEIINVNWGKKGAFLQIVYRFRSTGSGILDLPQQPSTRSETEPHSNQWTTGFEVFEDGRLQGAGVNPDGSVIEMEIIGNVTLSGSTNLSFGTGTTLGPSILIPTNYIKAGRGAGSDSFDITATLLNADIQYYGILFPIPTMGFAGYGVTGTGQIIGGIAITWDNLKVRIVDTDEIYDMYSFLLRPVTSLFDVVISLRFEFKPAADIED